MKNKPDLSVPDKELIKIAGQHAKEMYKPDFISIGAALRTKSGKVYTGINLKYRVRNISACAETMAIHAALNDGQTEFGTVVGVKYFPETDSYEVVNACGWCRQLFSYNTPLRVIINDGDNLKAVSTEELIPYAFK